MFIPKYRRKRIYIQIREDLAELFHKLARHKESQIEEWHICIDYIHMLISVPPKKYSVSQVIGYIKERSAMYIAKNYFGRTINFNSMSFWARGYFVSTVGSDETVIKEYITKQEAAEKKLEQLELFKYNQ